MYKIAFWISLVLIVFGLVVAAPMFNPALAGEAATKPAEAQQNGQQAERQAVKDEIIATRIDAAYLHERRLRPYYIEVVVEAGVVTLKGSVATEKHRELALYIASGQEYVRDVIDEIEVHQAGLTHTGAVVMDAGGAAHASADSAPDTQKQAAEAEEDGLGGMLSDAGTVAKVKTRLVLHFGFTGMAINVDAKDSVVRLTGTVDDPELVPQVERVAASTPGVKLVRNELRVEPATSSV